VAAIAVEDDADMMRERPSSDIACEPPRIEIIE
jgi:hypothetical protein